MTIQAALPPERRGQVAPDDLAERRRQMATAMSAGLWRTDPPSIEVELAGRRALRFEPQGRPRGLVLHFHGGAFRIGAPEAVGPFAAALAAKCGVTIVCPAYRLAPEHPFPAAFTDGVDVMRALGDTGGLPLILSGDSAGGGLAAGLAAQVWGRMIAGVILLSPWLDLTASSDSYVQNAGTDPLFSEATAVEAAELYLQGVPATHPVASPLLGGVAGFPPTFISVGSGEVLLDDSTRLHARLLEAGINANLSVIPGMEHVAVTRGLSLPGAADTFAAAAGFIDGLLARRP